MTAEYWEIILACIHSRVISYMYFLTFKVEMLTYHQLMNLRFPFHQHQSTPDITHR